MVRLAWRLTVECEMKGSKFYRKRIDNVILTAWISWCSSCCIIMDGCSTRSVSSAPSGVCHPDADTHRRKKSNPIQSIEESASYEDVRVDLVFESKFGDRHRRFRTRVNLITPKKKARWKLKGYEVLCLGRPSAGMFPTPLLEVPRLAPAHQHWSRKVKR